MWKVVLIWLALLAFFFLRMMTAGKYSSGEKFWTNLFMWTLILGVIGMLSMCFGGGGGSDRDCSYSNSGYTCS